MPPKLERSPLARPRFAQFPSCPPRFRFPICISRVGPGDGYAVSPELGRGTFRAQHAPDANTVSGRPGRLPNLTRSPALPDPAPGISSVARRVFRPGTFPARGSVSARFRGLHRSCIAISAIPGAIAPTRTRPSVRTKCIAPGSRRRSLLHRFFSGPRLLGPGKRNGAARRMHDASPPGTADTGRSRLHQEALEHALTTPVSGNVKSRNDQGDAVRPLVSGW